MTAPGIPNDYAISTSCFGTRLGDIQDQVFMAVGMGFRRIELGWSESPPAMDSLVEAQRETGVEVVAMIAGCRDAQSPEMPATRLASLDDDLRQRAIASIRRHARLAQSWACPTLVIRGSQVEDPAFVQEARALESEARKNGMRPELREQIGELVQRVQRAGQRQVDALCRSLHLLLNEFPGLRFALEPGRYIDDLLGFDAMGWVLDDLERLGLGYWHDVGRLHLRERQGLPPQARWLDAYAPRMLGLHLQDAAAEEGALPLGLGEVDFKLLREYVPTGAERVLELHHRHGRAEVLSSVQFAVDAGF
ncbi:MAG TPA: TIM barrel protein [Planctomycetota bacterium]|nr:TIM barrel protein [Planctomycetota bacterium]